jgi:3-methyladenine DNA glycosylase Tag
LRRCWIQKKTAASCVAIKRRTRGSSQPIPNARRGQFQGQFRWRALRQIPTTTAESDAFSRDLKRRGFSFVGSTVIYAHMQAVGMVNDHLVDCFRYRDVSRLGSAVRRGNQAKTR